MQNDDLKDKLVSELDNFSMVEFVPEWVFGFCKFYRVPRCGLGELTFIDFLEFE